MWWLLIFALQSDGLHWDTRCMLMPPEGAPIALEFMLVPHPVWLAQLDSIDFTPAQVDSALNQDLQAAARPHGLICRPLKRHYDPSHIEAARYWPARRYEPYVGWFLARQCGPAMPPQRKTDGTKTQR